MHQADLKHFDPSVAIERKPEAQEPRGIQRI
jgi:hypothetical protein